MVFRDSRPSRHRAGPESPADPAPDTELEPYLAAAAPRTDPAYSELGVRIASPQAYQVRLPGPQAERLRELAEARGVPPTSLLLDWALERLDREVGPLPSPRVETPRPAGRTEPTPAEVTRADPPTSESRPVSGSRSSTTPDALDSPTVVTRAPAAAGSHRAPVRERSERHSGDDPFEAASTDPLALLAAPDPSAPTLAGPDVEGATPSTSSRSGRRGAGSARPARRRSSGPTAAGLTPALPGLALDEDPAELTAEIPRLLDRGGSLGEPADRTPSVPASEEPVTEEPATDSPALDPQGAEVGSDPAGDSPSAGSEPTDGQPVEEQPGAPDRAKATRHGSSVTPIFRAGTELPDPDAHSGPRHRAPEPVTSLLTRRKF